MTSYTIGLSPPLVSSPFPNLYDMPVKYNRRNNAYLRLARKAHAGSPSLQIVFLDAAGSAVPDGYVEKFPNTRSGVYPWKAFAYLGRMAYEDPVMVGKFFDDDGGLDAAISVIRTARGK